MMGDTRAQSFLDKLIHFRYATPSSITFFYFQMIVILFNICLCFRISCQAGTITQSLMVRRSLSKLMPTLITGRPHKAKRSG